MSTDLNSMLQHAASLRQAGRQAEAAAAYERLLAQWPGLPDSWYNLGLLQRQLGRYEAALESYQKALDLGVRDPQEARLNRGVILADHLHRPEAAASEYEAAIAIDPRYWPARFNLANLYEDRGLRSEAQEQYRRVLSLNPKAWEALARLAGLAEAEEARTYILQIDAALDRADVSTEDKASLAFAQGRLLDAVGEYAHAFAAYARANALSRRAGGRAYVRNEQTALTDRIIAAFPEAERRTSELRAKPPIFICGMFRSGSTLTEQVLAGHPRITPGGELDIIPRLVRTALSPFPEAASWLEPKDCERLASEYLAELKRSFPEADLVTDKRPDNFLYVGLIKRLFPEARIVHTRRHPLDNILSVYFLHLDRSMSYALDLTDAAHYYREQRRLMAHWRSLYPGDIYEFDYDDFVREPRRNVEALLAFLGLDWSDDCLAFHQRTNAVKTASVWQVREPLYRRASGRWRNYSKELEPAREILADLLEPE
jgi:tetratricopeptide (TPR) repeat protein